MRWFESSYPSFLRRRGGIGRRAGLKIQCPLRACRFDPGRRYHNELLMCLTLGVFFSSLSIRTDAWCKNKSGSEWTSFCLRFFCYRAIFFLKRCPTLYTENHSTSWKEPYLLPYKKLKWIKVMKMKKNVFLSDDFYELLSLLQRAENGPYHSLSLVRVLQGSKR